MREYPAYMLIAKGNIAMATDAKAFESSLTGKPEVVDDLLDKIRDILSAADNLTHAAKTSTDNTITSAVADVTGAADALRRLVPEQGAQTIGPGSVGTTISPPGPVSQPSGSALGTYDMGAVTAAQPSEQENVGFSTSADDDDEGLDTSPDEDHGDDSSFNQDDPGRSNAQGQNAFGDVVSPEGKEKKGTKGGKARNKTGELPAAPSQEGGNDAPAFTPFGGESGRDGLDSSPDKSNSY